MASPPKGHRVRGLGGGPGGSLEIGLGTGLGTGRRGNESKMGLECSAGVELKGRFKREAEGGGGGEGIKTQQQTNQ